ncbi:MAG: glycosyltransferase [Gemmatimonadales bacterium]
MSTRRVLLVEVNRDGTVGGSHQAMFDLARTLDRRRYLPVCLFYEKNSFADRLRGLGFEVLLWDAEWEREHLTPSRWFTPRRAMGIVGAVARRVALLRAQRIDLVHINNSPSWSYYDWLPAARMVGIPCITHLRGELHPMRNGIVRWLTSRFDHYISISSYVTEILRSERFPSQRITQIEDGVDAENLRRSVRRSRADVRADLGVPSDALLAVMAGHLKEWKGQDVVLRALAGLAPELRARISVAFAGSDDPRSTAFRKHLDDLVRTHQLESCVQFLGRRDDVPDLMNAADIVLHASTRPEPFGLVLVEGMALGRLVIAAALGGPVQIMGEDSDWIFDPRVPSQLTRLLRRVIERPEIAAENTSVSVARAEAYSARRTTHRVQNLYDQLLA